ncbi:MAG: hypothetical protein HOJ18_07050, partial [Rhodospirillaceae bacterium]|nr:hypothetical protein [Rhodospirillaceae bacterium]
THRFEQQESTRLVYFGPDIGTTAARVVSRFNLTVEAKEGPMIIEEYEGTVVVPPNCSARIDSQGNIVIALSIS